MGVNYGSHNVTIVKSRVFDAWLRGLRDAKGRAKVLVRIERFAAGNPGDTGSVGDGVYEMRIDFGPGYRVYFLTKADLVVVLLAGGDKSSQQRDIVRAKMIASEWRMTNG